MRQQDVVKIHRISDQIPAICTDKGTEISQTYMDEHLKSTLHAEAAKANRLQSLKVKQLVDNKAMIYSSISKIHEALYQEIGIQMITVFNDAKRDSLRAWSWPSREIAHRKGLYLDCTSLSMGVKAVM